MKIELTVTTGPHSFEAEDEISNTLQDDGARDKLQAAIETAIEETMGWQPFRVEVQASI